MRVPEAPAPRHSGETSPGPEAAFYFTTPALTQRLELIRHLIDQSDRLLLVIGERESGKTTLADQLLTRAPDRWLVTRFRANPMLDSRLLLRDLAVSIGASAAGADRKALTEAIGAILRQREQQSLISVLFVDDAHELPADALKLLFGFARGRSKPGALRVVLLCEPHINTILEAPELQSLRETIVHILDMPSLTLEQTRAYLEARYNQTGLASFLPLDGTEVARIHGGSAGSPGRIDHLMRQTLKQPPPAGSESDESSPRLGSIAKHQWRLNTVAALLTAVSIIIAIDSLQDQFLRLPSEDPAPIDLSSPKQAQLAPPAARPQPPKTNQPRLKSGPAPTAGENTRIEPVLTRPRPLPPDQYVLQLLALRDPAAGERFLAQHQLGGRARVVAIRRKGQTWYLVVLGPFPDRHAASAAVRTLPKAIQAQQPWPRRIAGLEALGNRPRR